MKKTMIAALAFVFLTSLFSLAFAEQKMQVNKLGYVRLVGGWKDLSAEQKEAQEKIGEEIPIYINVFFEREGVFYRIVIKEYDEMIVWNGLKFKTLPKKGTDRGKPIFAIHVLLAMFAIVLLIISSIATSRGKHTFDSFSLIAGFVVLVSFFFSTGIVGIAAIFAGIIAAATSIMGIIVYMAMQSKNVKVHRRLVVVMYIYCIIFLLL